MSRVHPFALALLTIALLLARTPASLAEYGCGSGFQGSCTDGREAGAGAIAGGVGAAGSGFSIPNLSLPDPEKKNRRIRDELTPKAPLCDPTTGSTDEGSLPGIRSKPQLETFMKANPRQKLWKEHGPLMRAASDAYKLPLPLVACTMTRGGRMHGDTPVNEDHISNFKNGLAQLGNPPLRDAEGTGSPAGQPGAQPAAPNSEHQVDQKGARLPLASEETLDRLRAVMKLEFDAKRVSEAPVVHELNEFIKKAPAELDAKHAEEIEAVNRQEREQLAKIEADADAAAFKAESIKKTKEAAATARTSLDKDWPERKKKAIEELNAQLKPQLEKALAAQQDSRKAAAESVSSAAPAVAPPATAAGKPAAPGKPGTPAPPTDSLESRRAQALNLYNAEVYPNLSAWESYLRKAKANGVKGLPANVAQLNVPQAELNKPVTQVGYGAMNLNRLMDVYHERIKVGGPERSTDFRGNPGVDALVTVAMMHLMGEKEAQATFPNAENLQTVPELDEWLASPKLSNAYKRLANQLKQCIAAPTNAATPLASETIAAKPKTGQNDPPEKTVTVNPGETEAGPDQSIKPPKPGEKPARTADQSADRKGNG